MVKYTRYTDLELVDLLKSKDHEAFTEVYNVY